MTDETKKLFDATWEIFAIFPGYDIATPKRKKLIAHAYNKENASRIARLPELYDSLNKQAYYRCCDCLRVSAKMIDDIPLNRDMIEHGCPKNRTDCGAFDVWPLLKKVRDGE